MKFQRFVKTAFVVALVLMLAVPVPAYAVPELDEDQTDLSEQEIADALASGAVSLSGIDDNGDDLYAAEGLSLLSNGNSAGYVFTTIGGATRLETSVQEALSVYSEASTVIVASSDSYADSIAGSCLAGALDAPILLTNSKELTSVTSDAIKSLGASKIIILGGTAAVSENVASALKQLVGESNVERLAGETRYGTQMQIYNYGVTNEYWTGDTAIVATGNNFPDALAVSPVAFALKAPVFFMDGNNALPAEQLKALQASGKKTYLLVGGTTVAPDSVKKQLEKLGTVHRLGGATRYETAQAVDNFAVANYGFTWDYVAFASGQAPWDCLGGGVMQGKNKRVISLLDYSSAKSTPTIYAGSFSHAVYVGGKNVYSNAFKAQVAYKLGYKVSSIEGFKVYIDAGHGNNSSNNGVWDSGALGSGYIEANLTSELADKVANSLRNTYGMNVYVNKSGWYKLRQAQASELDCGLFISIHFNSSEVSSVSGTESYIHSRNAAWGSSKLQAAVAPRLVSALGLPDRGVKSEEFAVCSGKLPATLLEICFITNGNDMATFTAKKDAVAAAIAQGIVES